MIVNDMVTLGALPLAVAMHLGAGSSDWFTDERRAGDLVSGWKKACELARCAWGGGETPTLSGVVEPQTVVLAGSAIGIIRPKGRLIRGNIQAGDAIVLFESSGIHANGLTLARVDGRRARRTAISRPWATAGRTARRCSIPRTSTSASIEDCLNRGVEIHYAVNITGHGWRKLMRASGSVRVRRRQGAARRSPCSTFMQSAATSTTPRRTATSTWAPDSRSMCLRRTCAAVLDVAKAFPFKALRAGHIEESETRSAWSSRPKAWSTPPKPSRSGRGQTLFFRFS